MKNLKDYCQVCEKKVSKIERHKKTNMHIKIENAINNQNKKKCEA